MPLFLKVAMLLDLCTLCKFSPGKCYLHLGKTKIRINLCCHKLLCCAKYFDDTMLFIGHATYFDVLAG